MDEQCDEWKLPEVLRGYVYSKGRGVIDEVFVTGINVQLGHDVMNELNKRGHEGVGSDITNKEAVENAIKEVKPDAIIHCVA